MTEREWQGLENTMRFIVEQQAKFEANFVRHERRIPKSEHRLDRLAERVIRDDDRRMAAAEDRMEKSEEPTARVRVEMDD